MIHIDPDTGTVMLNCAVVPRWSQDPFHEVHGNLHHFTLVSICAEGNFVESASHVWVVVNGKQCQTVMFEQLMQTDSCQDDKLTRTCLQTSGSLQIPLCPDFASDGPHIQRVTCSRYAHDSSR